jgi:transcriptional regulator with XRE-family HTH domain
MTLKEWISEQNITIAEAAERIGISRMSVYSYIRGSRLPRHKAMRKIARATGGKVQPNDY